MGSDATSGLRRMVVEVTGSCNHACRHCYNYWRSDGEVSDPVETLSRAEIVGLIRKAAADAPLEQVALSGGEPLLRDDLPEIVRDLEAAGLDSVVISNGALLTEERLRRFPPSTTFEVTLFAADAQLHDRIAGRPGAFRRTVEGLVRAERRGCGFVLALVVTRWNAHDTLRTIELGIALGARAVLLNRLNMSRSMLPAAWNLAPSAEQMASSLEAAQTAVERYGVTVAVSVPVPPCVVDPRDYPKLHFGWCPRGSDDSYYTLGSDGTLRPCNHSSRKLGDLRRQGFAEIVGNGRAAEFWEPVPEECRSCEHPLREMCRGGCPAAADECWGTRRLADPWVAYSRRRRPFREARRRFAGASFGR